MNACIPRRSAFNHGVAALVSGYSSRSQMPTLSALRESGGRAVGDALKNLLGGKKDKQDNKPRRRP